MRQVAKEDLSGFRRPDRPEVEKMTPVVCRKLRLERRAMKIWFAICAFLNLAFWPGLLIGWREMAAGELGIAVLLAVIVLTALIFLFKGLKHNQKLLTQVQNGGFEVLDCYAYENSLSTDSVGSGIVRICTEQGQYCRDSFLVDLSSAREWSVRRNMKFWLLKCSCGDGHEKTYYQLFSEKMMQ